MLSNLFNLAVTPCIYEFIRPKKAFTFELINVVSNYSSTIQVTENTLRIGLSQYWPVETQCQGYKIKLLNTLNWL